MKTVSKWPLLYLVFLLLQVQVQWYLLDQKPCKAFLEPDTDEHGC